MSFADRDAYLTDEQRAILLDLAQTSIAHGLLHGCSAPVEAVDYDGVLSMNGASFITLHINHDLRGCIGSIRAFQPLVVDVSHNAFAAAFSDPRFPPLNPGEFENLTYHISVLSTPEALPCRSENELLNSLRPGIDGLILEDRQYRSTFLPAVWDVLPDPEDFISHLKRKAGLPDDYWSPTLTFRRYTVESIKA